MTTLRNTLAVLVVVAAIVAVGLGWVNHARADVPAPQPVAAPVVAPVGIEPGSVPAVEGGWIASGFCEGQLVSPTTLQMMFDPGVIGGNTGTGDVAVSVPQSAGPEVVAMTFGGCTVTLDPDARTVVVTGAVEDGCNTLQRDIDRCVTGPVEAWTSSGVWVDGKYVDTSFPELAPLADGTDG